MSSLITNPEYLSKDRLKSELKTHGIRFNQNENKQYYVNLYRKRLMDTEQSRHEFSSDEEFTRSPKQEKKQQKRKKIVKIDSYLPDVQLLIDSELKDELEKFDKDIGPITDTTRVLYQRMLAKLMAENVTGKSGVSRTVQPRDSTEEEDEIGVGRNNSYVGEWSSEDSEEEEESVRPSLPPPSQLKKRVGIVREPAPPAAAAAKKADRPQGKVHRRTAPKSTSLQGFMVLLLMFAIAFFSYEHYTSTEEDPSLITKEWKNLKCLWNHVKDYIIKTPSPEDKTPQPNNDLPTTPPPTEEVTQPPPTEPPTEEPTRPSPKKTADKTKSKTEKSKN